MTDGTILLAQLGIGAVLAWAACLLVGCRLLAPDHAVAIGVAGLWIGWAVFRKLELPSGPSFDGIELFPGFVGTLLVLSVYLAVRAAWERRKDGITPPPPRPLD
ncbi:MAG: hypothetical protein ACREQJ_17290, partial [Candidatus Binatia bacterium]